MTMKINKENAYIVLHKGESIITAQDAERLLKYSNQKNATGIEFALKTM